MWCQGVHEPGHCIGHGLGLEVVVETRVSMPSQNEKSPTALKVSVAQHFD